MAIKRKYIKGEHLEPKSSSNIYYIDNCPTDLNVHKILRDLYLHRGYVVNPETWDSNQSAKLRGINYFTKGKSARRSGSMSNFCALDSMSRGRGLRTKFTTNRLTDSLGDNATNTNSSITSHFLPTDVGIEAAKDALVFNRILRLRSLSSTRDNVLMSALSFEESRLSGCKICFHEQYLADAAFAVYSDSKYIEKYNTIYSSREYKKLSTCCKETLHILRKYLRMLPVSKLETTELGKVGCAIEATCNVLGTDNIRKGISTYNQRVERHLKQYAEEVDNPDRRTSINNPRETAEVRLAENIVDARLLLNVDNGRILDAYKHVVPGKLPIHTVLTKELDRILDLAHSCLDANTRVLAMEFSSDETEVLHVTSTGPYSADSSWVRRSSQVLRGGNNVVTTKHGEKIIYPGFTQEDISGFTYLLRGYHRLKETGDLLSAISLRSDVFPFNSYGSYNDHVSPIIFQCINALLAHISPNQEVFTKLIRAEVKANMSSRERMMDNAEPSVLLFATECDLPKELYAMWACWSTNSGNRFKHSSSTGNLLRTYILLRIMSRMCALIYKTIKRNKDRINSDEFLRIILFNTIKIITTTLECSVAANQTASKSPQYSTLVKYVFRSELPTTMDNEIIRIIMLNNHMDYMVSLLGFKLLGTELDDAVDSHIASSTRDGSRPWYVDNTTDFVDGPSSSSINRKMRLGGLKYETR